MLEIKQSQLGVVDIQHFKGPARTGARVLLELACTLGMA